jgi:hypothetical protein
VSVGFIKKKFVMLHGHMNVKLVPVAVNVNTIRTGECAVVTISLVIDCI